MKFRGREKKLYMCFVDLEKAFDWAEFPKLGSATTAQGIRDNAAKV